MSFNYYLIVNKILSELIPLTFNSVEKGNKIFGAIILKKDDYSTLAVDTNNEIVNPILHGEISTINNFFNKKLNIDPKNCIFISSHEPCSLCLSAITWGGFDNFIYLFPYSDTENKFNIPHDLKILKEVFNIENGNYNKQNEYWESYSLFDQIKLLENNEKNKINKKLTEIKEKYKNLSFLYQKNKDNNKIPLN